MMKPYPLIDTYTPDVLVFKTSVQSEESVEGLRPLLDVLAGKNCWNFALDDSDRVLRVKAHRDKLSLTIKILNRMGYHCEELDD